MRRTISRLALLLAAGCALLTGCIEGSSECEGFQIEEVSAEELDALFPKIVGTNREVRHSQDSSSFPIECLRERRPELAERVGYFETRASLDGKTVYLFDSAPDTLVGFTKESRWKAFVVSVL